MKCLLLVFITIILSGCQSNKTIDLDLTASVVEIANPCIVGGESNLFVDGRGKVYLSWVEHVQDSMSVLQYATLKDSVWSEPKTIASGTNWFVNWADFPSMVVSSSGNAMAAHWLAKSADGTYDYDIHISTSSDKGKTWSPSFVPHTDGISAEHGFVSMLPLDNGKVFATWLDGRNTKAVSTSKGDEHSDNHDDEHAEDDHGHDHAGGPMTLRCATFDMEGKLYDEAELDSRVCDCCQTSATKSSEGIVVAYRDRSEREVRDISVVRQNGDSWTEPDQVNNDNWFMPGCPVNGPVIRSMGSQVVTAWFTMNDTIPEVRMAFSTDNAASFSEPIIIDHDDPIGRVDVDFVSANKVLVSWLEDKEDGDAVLSAMLVDTNGTLGKVYEIAKAKSGRGTGVPRMAVIDEGVIFTYTSMGESSKIVTKMLRWQE